MSSAALDGAVATVTIDRPDRRNAFDTAMWEALPQIVRAIEAEDGARVIILRGAGGQAFSAGADITEFAEKRATADAARAYDAVTEEAYDAVQSFAFAVHCRHSRLLLRRRAGACALL